MDQRAHMDSEADTAKFSILIPTWNNLAFVQMCVRSLRENSAFPHQIILHINDGTAGTRDWAIAENIPHTRSPENIGVCTALNQASTLATTGYICFFNDDMYALPDWDRPLWDLIEQFDHRRWFLSGTMIEPTDTGNPCVIAPRDYGRSLDTFRDLDLLEDFRWQQRGIHSGHVE